MNVQLLDKVAPTLGNWYAPIQDDLERTKEDGKTSSIHFLHFPFTADQVKQFRAPGARVVLAIGHENYAHMAVLSEAARAALATDFDPL